MDQYNMIFPNNNKIYFETNPKNVALKVFRKLNKDNVNQKRIIFENNSTKKRYEYIAMTNKKFNDYKKLASIQTGGSNISDDKEFLNQLKKVSDDLDLSFKEFKKVIDSKTQPKNNNDVFVKVVDQLDKLDDKVDILSKQFNLTPKNESISDSVKNIEDNIDKIIDSQKKNKQKNNDFVEVVDQLDNLNEKVLTLSKQFNLNMSNKNPSESLTDSINTINQNIQQIIDTKNTKKKEEIKKDEIKEEIKKEESSNYCIIS